MTLFLKIFASILLFATLSISIVSITASVGSFLLNKRATSTCFIAVWLLCVISCLLHPRPIPTWFRFVGIATMSLSALEISARGVNLVRKQILRSFSFRWKMSSRWKIILSSLCLATVLFAVLRPCSGYKDYALALMFDQGQTVFAPMFREQNFKKVSVGMTSNEVQVLLGVPLAESWWYGFSHDIRDVFLCIDIKDTKIMDVHWWNETIRDTEELQSISSKIKPGMSISEIQSTVFNIPTPSQGTFQETFSLARPVTVLWAYSMTTNSSSYHQRIIYFQEGKVYRKVASFYVD